MVYSVGYGFKCFKLGIEEFVCCVHDPESAAFLLPISFTSKGERTLVKEK